VQRKAAGKAIGHAHPRAQGLAGGDRRASLPVVPDVIVIGDGPGGLSAALFLAKNGKDVVVFGQDKTAMHWAMLNNYLGIEQIHGSEFQKTARAQVTAKGGTIRDERIESVEKTASGFTVRTEGGEALAAKYLVLSEGKSPRLATMLGLQHDPGTGVRTDKHSHSDVQGVYVVGRLSRPGRSQAIISAGDGAAAAIDILSREKGENVTDWDSPPES
jgi:thioredoxin reductase (NADPH)